MNGTIITSLLKLILSSINAILIKNLFFNIYPKIVLLFQGFLIKVVLDYKNKVASLKLNKI